MANLNKELKKLFFATLKRKAEEASRRTSPTYGGGGYCGGMMPPVTHRPTTYQPNLFSQTDGVGCIYFYEWSDTTRIPKSYYTLKAFEAFLNDCHTPSTASTATNRGSEDVEPYSVAITRPPSMRHMETVFEPEGRWFG